MVAKAIGDLPEIKWETADVLEDDPDERLVVYNATGEDKDGNKYSGSAHFIHGEFEEVKDIESI